MRTGTALAALALLGIATGCGSPGSSANAESSRPAGNPMEIAVRPDLMREIAVGEPRWSAVSSTLKVAGRIEADETRMARINAPVAGRGMELHVVDGQNVTRGEVLAVIHSTDLSAVQSLFLKAHSQRLLAERSVSRARLLLDAGVIGEAELQRRETELEQAAAELSAAREQLAVLGMTEQALEALQNTRVVDSLIRVVASIDGRVLERKVTIGQVVQAAETMCIVADLSNVWLVADIPEQSAGGLQAGKRVEAEIPALPGIRISGRLTYVSAVVNPETRTVRARMDVPNPERAYKPAMLATVTLLDGSERRRMVPANAIVREGNREHVFVEIAPGKFLLRPVTVGAEFGNARVLADGLGEGERIVVNGAFHLNNERKRLAMQAGEAE